jgi:hypothetical protein
MCFKYIKNYEINKFKNHKQSHKKYWFKFVDFKIEYNIWWDCTFKHHLIVCFLIYSKSPVIFYQIIFLNVMFIGGQSWASKFLWTENNTFGINT